METLQYYFEDGTLVIFEKYTIDTDGIIRNKKTGKVLSIRVNDDGYKNVSVKNICGKQCSLLVGRALLSTFEGQPMTSKHTADHIDRYRENDTSVNTRWATKKEQNDNQERPETYKSALVVVKDGIGKTIKEWVEHLKGEKNHKGREYTMGMIQQYSQQKKFGFSYKEYPDLQSEVWKEITLSKTWKGYWKISNMNRVKYITEHSENVLSSGRLRLQNGYPVIKFNDKHWYCHTLAFMAFFPDKWASKKSDEFILHEDDNKLDFSPHKLRLGTRSENGIDAHDNGCFDGKKKERQRCISYINGVLEKEHDSQENAAAYLKSIGYEKAAASGIRGSLRAFREGKTTVRYDRTWRMI